MTHSPEPWGCHDKGTEFPTICKEYNENTCHEIAELTGCFGMTHEEKVANGERIVACVNACAGIPTEELNSEALYLKPTLLMDDYQAILKYIHSRMLGGYAQCVLHPKEWNLLVKHHAPDLPPNAHLRIDGITVRPMAHPGDWT